MNNKQYDSFPSRDDLSGRLWQIQPQPGVRNEDDLIGYFIHVTIAVVLSTLLTNISHFVLQKKEKFSSFLKQGFSRIMHNQCILHMNFFSFISYY